MELFAFCVKELGVGGSSLVFSCIPTLPLLPSERVIIGFSIVIRLKFMLQV